MLTQYLLRSSRLRACCIYQKESMFGWHEPKGGTLKLRPAAAAAGKGMPPVQTHLVGRRPDRVPAEPA